MLSLYLRERLVTTASTTTSISSSIIRNHHFETFTKFDIKMASTSMRNRAEKLDVNVINHSDDTKSDTTSTMSSRLDEASSIDFEMPSVTRHDQHELLSVHGPTDDIPGNEIRQAQFSSKVPQKIPLIIISQVDVIPTLAALHWYLELSANSQGPTYTLN